MHDFPTSTLVMSGLAMSFLAFVFGGKKVGSGTFWTIGVYMIFIGWLQYIGY